jgi:hypothetical protein
VVIALIIWCSPQIEGCSNALEKSLELTVLKRRTGRSYEELYFEDFFSFLFLLF